MKTGRNDNADLKIIQEDYRDLIGKSNYFYDLRKHLHMPEYLNII